MTRLSKITWILIFVSMLCAEASGQQYAVSALGHLSSVVQLDAMGGVNDSGQVAVSMVSPSTAQFHAFLYDPNLGGMVDLGNLGGTYSRANGINNSGAIVGKATTPDGSVHAFLYTHSGGMQDIHPLVSVGGTQSSALAITDGGLIVGWSTDGAGNEHAFLYNQITSSLADIQQLLPFGGTSSAAYSVNSASQIVGVADVGSGASHAFSYDMSTAIATDLGTLGGNASVALGIDSGGTIVGSADVSATSFQGFEVSIGSTVNGSPAGALGTLGGPSSAANSANDADQVVGGAQLPNGNTDAFLWDPINGLRDLNNLLAAGTGWTLVEAQGISSSGLIVGFGYDADGEHQLFLLRPQSSASLVVTASSASMVYGGTVPIIRPSYTGFVNGDTASSLTTAPTCLTTATSSSPVGTYPTTCSGAVDANYTISYVPGELSITQDSTSSSVLSSATPSFLGQSVTFTATVSANPPGSGTPTGTVTFGDGTSTLGAGSLASGQATFATSTLAVGSHSVAALYGGDTNFMASSGSLAQQVEYNICALYDQTKAVQNGATVPIKLYLCDINGNDVSSPSVVLQATQVVAVSGYSGTPESPGSSNPDSDFVFDSTLATTGGYHFNLKTTGLAPGTYRLMFVVSNDPVTHSVSFGVQ